MLKSYVTVLCVALMGSATAQQYQLDSLVHTVNGAQYIAAQKYHSASKNAELIRYERPEAGADIQKVERSLLTYDTNGNQLSHVFASWNTASNTWEELEKTEKEFNADNNVTRVCTYQLRQDKWQKTSENIRQYLKDSLIESYYELRETSLLPIQKSVSCLNALDKVVSHEIFIWKDLQNAWEPLQKTTNHYQQDSTLIAYETLAWKDNQYQNYEKVVYVLDAEGLKTDSYTLYEGSNDSWQPYKKFEFLPLATANKSVNNSYRWSAEDNKWMLLAQVETYHNSDGKKQDVLFSEWDMLTNELKLQSEQLNLYDKEGRLSLFQSFDYMNGVKLGTQNTAKFDPQGNVMEESTYAWDEDTDNWLQQTNTYITYDPAIAVVHTEEGHQKLDFFSLSDYNYSSNKQAAKSVKTYKYQDGKKVLLGEFEFFYSVAP